MPLNAARKPKKKIKPVAESGLGWSADDRKKYGIAPKGAGPHPPSAYGFPLPPKGHPKAKAAARAVLSRAHQAGNFDPADVAKQVRKAKAILGEPSKKAESAANLRPLTPLLEIADGPESGTAKVIIIRSGPGSSGYYPPETLQAAVAAGIFEGAPCHFDHPTPDEDYQQPGRSVRSLAGWFSDAAITSYRDPQLGPCTAVEAIFHPEVGNEKTLSLLRTCSAYALRYPEKAYVGLSINARGDSSDVMVNGQPTVTAMDECYSVDFVTQAGAGGAVITFQECYRMSKTVKVDQAKLKEQGKVALTEAKAAAKAAKVKFLAESAIQLTPEQDQALDAALGLVDGGMLDQAIDKVTGVSPEDDEDDQEESDDETEADDNENDGEAELGDEHQNVSEDEDVTEADMAPFKGKSADELIGIAAKHKKKADKLANDAMAAKAQEAKRREALRGKLTEAQKQLKEHRVDAVVAAQKVPAAYVPMLKREIAKDGTLFSESSIAAFVRDYVTAYVKTARDGDGSSFREGADPHAPTKIAVVFTPKSAYAE